MTDIVLSQYPHDDQFSGDTVIVTLARNGQPVAARTAWDINQFVSLLRELFPEVEWHFNIVTAEVVEQDTTSLTGWLSLRREDVMQQASAIADAMVQAARGKYAMPSDDEYLMSIADKHDDMLDWLWMRGDTDL